MAFTSLFQLSLAFLPLAAFTPAVMASMSYNDTGEELVDKNFTDINPLEKIEEANRRFRETLVPCTAYIGILIVVGIIGNALAFYVFAFRLKRSPQNFFILLLAVLDLLSSLIGMPAEITDVTLHFKFDSPALCKVMRFVNAFAAMSSICTLVAIAVDRYRRVRKPLHPQITLFQARLCLIPIMATALILSIPSLYVYGLRTIESGFPGVYGLDCTISDQAKLTSVPLIYNSVLFFCFVVLAVSLIVMYSLILRSLKEHAKMLRKLSTCTVSTVMETLSINETGSGNEDSCSSAHVTDSDLVRKPSIPEQFCNPCADASTEAPSVEVPSGGDGQSDDVFSRNDDSYFSNVCNQSHTVQVKDSAHGGPCDCLQKDVTESSQASPWNHSHRSDTDGNESHLVTQRKNDIDLGDSSAAVPGLDSLADADNKDGELDSPEDTHHKDDHETENGSRIQDYSSGSKDATPRKPSVAHHVSFDVSCLNAPKSDLSPLKTWSSAFSSLGPTDKRKLSETSISSDLHRQSQEYVNQILQLQKCKKNQEKSKNQRLDSQKEKKQEAETPKQRQFTRKTTIIAFVVTLVFIISFVPHLCLQIAHLIRKGFDEELEGAPLALYNIFLRSYFLNSVANPIIYGLLNEAFRSEVKLLVSWLPCCRRKR